MRNRISWFLVVLVEMENTSKERNRENTQERKGRARQPGHWMFVCCWKFWFIMSSVNR